ncbi:MAG: MATE family efflux transporter [Bacilli bacterium]|nr:MATE family efflux transporter [Bacilli bacterium]
MKKSLTEGSILKSMILFALPLILGNMLQQLYNVVDTYIVGHFLGANALAGVGASYSIVTFITSLILGLCMGAGVLFSMLYGAKRDKELKNSFVISFVFIGVISVLIMGLSISFVDPLLKFLNVPNDIYVLTRNYIVIIFYGIFFTFLYNYFASLLRALGDSKTPLLFLGISTISNIILDITFILYISKSVKSVAYATIISQAISAIFMIVYTLHKKKEYVPYKEHCYLDKRIFNKFISYSLLTCIQQSVMNFGIMLVQGIVNSFGVTVMAGFSTAVKIDTLAYMPVQDFGNAFSTFVAQNKGANKEDRVNKGLKYACIVSILFCIVISSVIYMFAENFMMIFLNVNEIEAISVGVQYLRIEGACYIGIGLLFLWYGYYRGIGKPFISVILTVISLGTRVILSYTLSNISAIGVLGIWWSIPIGWFLADVTGLFYYLYKRHKAL